MTGLKPMRVMPSGLFFTCLQVAKFLNIAFPELKSC